MSVYAVPTSADACMQQFVDLLNAKVKNQTTYALFMPLVHELVEQSAGTISMTRVNQMLGGLPQNALGGGTVTFSWAQRSLYNSLGIPEDTFNGFCALAVGEFLVRPSTIRTKLTSQKGKIDLLHLHQRYRSSGKPSYEYITDTYELAFVGVTDVFALTPEATLWALEAHSGTKHLIGVTKTTGGGHAVGVIVAGGKYSFFDPEEGQAELADRNAFWRFLHRYITHTTKGLATDYQRVFVATWS